MIENEMLKTLLKEREFAYSEVYVHALAGQDIFDEWGVLKKCLDPEIASKCKNESNNTVIFAGARAISISSFPTIEEIPGQNHFSFLFLTDSSICIGNISRDG